MSVDTQGVPLIQLHRFRAPHGAHTAAAIEPYRRKVQGLMLIDWEMSDTSGNRLQDS